MQKAKLYKTRKIKGASIIGNDPDETWYCVRSKNFSPSEHRAFKKMFQTMCSDFLSEDVKEV